MPAGEQRDENLLDDRALADNDLAQLAVDFSTRGEKLLDYLLLGGFGERWWSGGLDGCGEFGCLCFSIHCCPLLFCPRITRMTRMVRV